MSCSAAVVLDEMIRPPQAPQRNVPSLAAALQGALTPGVTSPGGRSQRQVLRMRATLFAVGCMPLSDGAATRIIFPAEQIILQVSDISFHPEGEKKQTCCSTFNPPSILFILDHPFVSEIPSPVLFQPAIGG